jgi:hypothetical protein
MAVCMRMRMFGADADAGYSRGTHRAAAAKGVPRFPSPTLHITGHSTLHAYTQRMPLVKSSYNTPVGAMKLRLVAAQVHAAVEVKNHETDLIGTNIFQEGMQRHQCSPLLPPYASGLCVPGHVQMRCLQSLRNSQTQTWILSANNDMFVNMKSRAAASCLPHPQASHRQ